MDENRTETTRPDDEIEDVSAYAATAASYIRQLGNTGLPDWNNVFERGVRAAFAQNDLEGLTAIVHFAVGTLDGMGRFAEGLRETDHALALVEESADASCLLLAVRASFLVGRGDTEQALASLALAEARMAEASSAFARNRAGAYCAVVRCRTLAPEPLARLEALLGRARSYDNGIDFLFLLSWYIPYLFALGLRSRAQGWIRGMRLQADVVNHHWRARDALVFELSDRASESYVDISDLNALSPNWVAKWRGLALTLRRYVVRGDWKAAELCVADMNRIQLRNPSADLDPDDAFAACLSAHAQLGVAQVSLPIPRQVHLTNLAPILAAAEATALAGTQASAAEWLKWMSSSLPGNVRTSMEWNVSRDRIEGLLAVRSGDHRRARRLFSDAMQWAEAEGYQCEHAMAKVQLAELLALTDLGRNERVWVELKHEGWAALRALEIDPCAVAYEVSQSIAANRAENVRPQLSPREAELIARLAEGLTYREAAGSMGVAHATVQTLAHRIYEKLETSGRVRAIAVARELGII